MSLGALSGKPKVSSGATYLLRVAGKCLTRIMTTPGSIGELAPWILELSVLADETERRSFLGTLRRDLVTYKDRLLEYALPHKTDIAG